MIRYETSVEAISVDMIADGFFEGWPNPPSKDVHMQILRRSSYVVLAVDDVTSNIVGFITAISDGVLCSYIPLLEVLPRYRRQGIGNQLVHTMIRQRVTTT
ncbi:GNAT family N-acetyltransferase [Alicyclobacillus dauci]|uniref:GNAT family N-acetyltransferase n=1 Tax=Alicyclobacillus dauci TaxID=1475485 RepID=UPI002DD44739|nr:GNAT family N-acetyltransferase [Alicyclobacillus dauci]